MRVLKWIMLSAVLSLSLSIAAHADEKATKSALTCPVTGETITDKAKAPKFTYNNKTYYFCCANCVTKFKATPAKYLNPKNPKDACCEAEGVCATENGAKTAATKATPKTNATKATAATKATPKTSATKATPKTATTKAAGVKTAATKSATTPKEAGCCGEGADAGNTKAGGCCKDAHAGNTKAGGCCKDAHAGNTKAGGCCEEGTTDATTVKSDSAVVCAVKGSVISDPAHALQTQYDGKTYYFCCPGCQDKFLKEPAKYVKTK